MSDATNTAEPAPKSRKKAMLVAAAVGVLTLSGGGGAWWFLVHRSTDDAAAAAREAARREAARMFVTLDPFVVNLADRESERYAQVGVVLEVEGKEIEGKLSAKMPAVRNQILLLISSKPAAELTTREGKERLAAEIALASARPIGWTPPASRPEEPPAAKVKTKDGAADKGKDAKTPPKAAKAVEPPPNPVAAVHFSSFIVQ
jgi:flagellar FliL protein